MSTLYTVETPYAVAGVIVEDGVVIEAAPIFKWMVGKTWQEARQFRKITNIMTAKPNVESFLNNYTYALSGTGSRSLSVATKEERYAVFEWVLDHVTNLLETIDVLLVISGGAEGFDACLIRVAQHLGIDYLVALPSPSYGDYYWRDNSIHGIDRSRVFKRHCDQAAYVHYVCDHHKWGQANFVRNQWMANNANEFLVYDSTSRGTSDCVQRLTDAGVKFKEFDSNL